MAERSNAQILIAIVIAIAIGALMSWAGSDGGFAEYTKIHHRQILPINNNLSDAELANFSCSYTTAENLLNRVDCGKGDRVLITGPAQSRDQSSISTCVHCICAI